MAHSPPSRHLNDSRSFSEGNPEIPIGSPVLNEPSLGLCSQLPALASGVAASLQATCTPFQKATRPLISSAACFGSG